MEKLSISSASKGSKKRVLTATPPRSIRIGGSAVRVAPGSNNSKKHHNHNNDMFPEFNEPVTKSSAKRGRVAPPSTAGASILSKMVSKKTGSSQLRLGGASRPSSNHHNSSSGSGFHGSGMNSSRSSGTANSSNTNNNNNGSSRSLKLGVEHIVAWEKRSGKSWYKLSREEKEHEISRLKENLRN
jgi:hypothetical protein